MKKLLLGLFLFGCVISALGQKMDTIYFDKNWQGVKYKELAQYIRYDFDFKDANYENKARIFYIGGQLESEGTPVSKNKYDGTQARWKGELTRYFPNGIKKEVSNFDMDGALHGKKSIWNEKELLMSEENYEHGLRQGQSLVYDDENPDVCYLTQFDKDKPVNNEMFICFRSGRKTRVDYTTRKIITSNPTPSDLKSTSKNGAVIYYYDLNGIYVSLNFSITQQFGKYYLCTIQFVNNSMEPIEINPKNITGQYVKGKLTKPIEMMAAEDYLKRIARSQALSQALAGFSSGMATYNAGYSTSTSTATAVGSGGWASGTAVTTTFNPNERQAILNEEQQKLGNQAASDKKFKDAIDGNILKQTVVEPGEQIVKSFYVKYLSSDRLFINLMINDLVYPFQLDQK